jgi:hypothetical protein
MFEHFDLSGALSVSDALSSEANSKPPDVNL